VTHTRRSHIEERGGASLAGAAANRAAMVLVVALAALGAVSGCKRNRVESDVTGVSLTIHYDVAVGFRSFRITGLVGNASAFQPGMLPDPPRPLTKGTETLVILLPDALAGQTILLRVDGLAGDTVVGNGAQAVTLQRSRLVEGELTMGPVVVCGDHVMRMGFEQCDDGNTVDGDGCSSICMIEPAAACGPITCASGCCQDGVCEP